MDVYSYCFKNKYPKAISIILSHLCTYYESLPQGAPTSAYISNIVMKDFDDVVGLYCLDKKISYTRYSDDMTFSGDFIPSEIIHFVRNLLKKRNAIK